MRIQLYKLMQVKEAGVNYKMPASAINSPVLVKNILCDLFQLHEQACEQFGIFTLNTKNRITGVYTISIGTLDATMVHPREVFKAAMMSNAYSIILFHNHPSGDPTPSQEDIVMTKRLVEAGQLMGISVLDHVIIGDDRYASLKELGVMD